MLGGSFQKIRGKMVCTIHWLVVWNMFSHILGIIIPTDFHIFQRDRYTTNQVIYISPIQVAWWFQSWVLFFHALGCHRFSQIHRNGKRCWQNSRREGQLMDQSAVALPLQTDHLRLTRCHMRTYVNWVVRCCKP